jgi:hypothetical protein
MEVLDGDVVIAEGAVTGLTGIFTSVVIGLVSFTSILGFPSGVNDSEFSIKT